MNPISLETRLIKFSVATINFTKDIHNTYAGVHLSKQIIRSSTSVSLNYGETRGAESIKDFIHKMGIIVKELRETQVCFRLLEKAELHSSSDISTLIDECDELVSIFVASINTSKRKLRA